MTNLLPPNPTPTEVHVRLLTLLGWTIKQVSINEPDDDVWCIPPGVKPEDEWFHAPGEPPPLDDNLLRLCRERLLTTELLWEAYLEQLQIGGSEFENLQSVLETLVLTHAIAICRAVEKGEA